MIFLSLLIAGALVGVGAALVRTRRRADPVTAASLGSAAAFVAGGLWVGIVNPAARALDPGALGTGATAAIVATALQDAVATPYRRGPGRGTISRSGGIRRSSPAPGVQQPSSRRRSSGARHRAPDASLPTPKT